MKLEGELGSLHSKMGVELESQSFELNDDDQNSASFKSQNQNPKEYDNKVSKNVKKSESVDCMPAPKLGFYNSVIDLKNNYEAQVIGLVEPKSHSSREKSGLDPSPKLGFYDSPLDLKSGYRSKVINSVNPVSHSSNDIGSFMMFANDKQSVKKSISSPISSPLQVDKFQNSVDVFVDQTVTENSYNIVKDICVDKGVFTKHKFMIEESVDGKTYNFFPLESFDDDQKPQDYTGIKVLDLPESEKSDKVTSNHDQLNDDEIKDLVDSVTNAMDLHEDTQDSIPKDDKDELSGEPDFHSMLKESNMVDEEVLETPALGLPIDESNTDGSGSLAHHFAPSAPADCNSVDTHLPSMTTEGLSGNPAEIHHAETSQIRHGVGESSFSAAGAISGRISYSGSIPYSGSISIRSDSSTTSTRSFAFPILQSEWNSSPVRMEKPDRSRYRKRRNWKSGLLCCKF